MNKKILEDILAIRYRQDPADTTAASKYQPGVICYWHKMGPQKSKYQPAFKNTLFIIQHVYGMEIIIRDLYAKFPPFVFRTTAKQLKPCNFRGEVFSDLPDELKELGNKFTRKDVEKRQDGDPVPSVFQDTIQRPTPRVTRANNQAKTRTNTASSTVESREAEQAAGTIIESDSDTRSIELAQVEDNQPPDPIRGEVAYVRPTRANRMLDRLRNTSDWVQQTTRTRLRPRK